MPRAIPDPLDHYLGTADRVRVATARALYPLQVLDITRQVRSAVRRAKSVLLDLSDRWARPVGPTMTSVRGTHTMSATEPDRWLRDWRSPAGHEWSTVVQRIEQQLGQALGSDEPETVGWVQEKSGLWRLDLLEPLAEKALDSLQYVVLTAADSSGTTRWVRLDHFAPDEGARFFARRDCPTCGGDGLVEVPRRPDGGDIDTCACVRRLPS